MTEEEYSNLKRDFYAERIDGFAVMEAVIDLFFENLELKGKVYELQEIIDGRG